MVTKATNNRLGPVQIPPREHPKTTLIWGRYGTQAVQVFVRMPEDPADGGSLHIDDDRDMRTIERSFKRVPATNTFVPETGDNQPNRTEINVNYGVTTRSALKFLQTARLFKSRMKPAPEGDPYLSMHLRPEMGEQLSNTRTMLYPTQAFSRTVWVSEIVGPKNNPLATVYSTRFRRTKGEGPLTIRTIRVDAGARIYLKPQLSTPP